MTNEYWLTLTDYSNKHKVSLSTLRRRIKADEIKYRFSEGKYFISDEPVSTHQRSHRPSQDVHLGSMVSTHKEKSSHTKATNNQQAEKNTNIQNSAINKPLNLEASSTNNKQQEEPILSAASKLLVELKKAYMVILQEKEEQIIHLKEEISDLKTLVKVLESENQRLKNK